MKPWKGTVTDKFFGRNINDYTAKNVHITELMGYLPYEGTGMLDKNTFDIGPSPDASPNGNQDQHAVDNAGTPRMAASDAAVIAFANSQKRGTKMSIPGASESAGTAVSIVVPKR